MEPLHKSREGGKNGFIPGSIPGQEAFMKGSKSPDLVCGRPQERGDIFTRRETVLEIPKIGLHAFPGGGKQIETGRNPHRPEYGGYAFQDLPHLAVGKGGGDQGHKFTVQGVGIPVEEFEGVGMNIAAPIVGGVKSLQPFP